MHGIFALWCCLLWKYFCLNWTCRPTESTAIGLSDSYHNPASSTNVKQNLWTSTPSGKAWVFIQLFVLKWCASACSSGLPVNSSLKFDQFNGGTSPGHVGCTGGTTVCCRVSTCCSKHPKAVLWALLVVVYYLIAVGIQHVVLVVVVVLFLPFQVT